MNSHVKPHVKPHVKCHVKCHVKPPLNRILELHVESLYHPSQIKEEKERRKKQEELEKKNELLRKRREYEEKHRQARKRRKEEEERLEILYASRSRGRSLSSDNFESPYKRLPLMSNYSN